MFDESDWAGTIDRRPTVIPKLQVTTLLGPVADSIAKPFLAVASDGREWWVKPPIPQLERAPVAEFVVGKMGALIGAPVCEVATIEIPNALLPYDLEPGFPLPTGTGTGTVKLGGVVSEIRQNLEKRNKDDNRVRHAGIYALVDLCYGSDLQWLHQVDLDWTITSHDHGWYFPPYGQTWSASTLRSELRKCAFPQDSAYGLDEDHLKLMSDTLRMVRPDQILDILNDVPAIWPVTDVELETLGWFLYRRAADVSARLLTL